MERARPSPASHRIVAARGLPPASGARERPHTHARGSRNRTVHPRISTVVQRVVDAGSPRRREGGDPTLTAEAHPKRLGIHWWESIGGLSLCLHPPAPPSRSSVVRSPPRFDLPGGWARRRALTEHAARTRRCSSPPPFFASLSARTRGAVADWFGRKPWPLPEWRPSSAGPRPGGERS